MADFGDLYSYVNSTGTVIPDVSDIKSTVENAFKGIFGSEFSVAEETPNGRLIEAITLLFKGVCCVNAQNASMVNPNNAVGQFLDSIGALFNVSRNSGESDTSYRRSIMSCIVLGTGYAESIRKAVNNVTGTSNVVVLDNGLEDRAMLPIDEYGNATPHSVPVERHSVLVSVLGGTSADVADAIRRHKSAGCGYTRSTELGNVEEVTCNDASTSSPCKVYFYRPSRLYVKINVTVSDNAYSGGSIESDTKSAIVEYVNSLATCFTMQKADIVSCVAALGSGIVTTDVVVMTGSSSGSVTTVVDNLIVYPTKYVSISASDVTVTVI